MDQMKWINYHHLYYFKAIAEEGSVSRAAEKLRLGQPTLSAQLKQFEDSLGIALFERSHKRLILTEQGKVALEYAKSIFQLGSEMYEVLQDRLRPQKPSVCIAAIDSIPKQIILQLTKEALKVSPCQITLLEGKPDELLRELSAHRVDILLTNRVPLAGEVKGTFHRLIAHSAVGLFGAPKFKHLRKGFPESLKGAPVVLPTHDSKLRYDLDHWSKVKQIPLDILVETQDISMKKLMAINGLGLIPTANYSVTKQVLEGDLLEIGTLEGVFEDLVLVTVDRKIKNPIATALMKDFNI